VHLGSGIEGRSFIHPINRLTRWETKFGMKVAPNKGRRKIMLKKTMVAMVTL